jgi:phosphomannomutase/phosphoglucomutase
MPQIPAHVFREYDIRGLVATELTPEFARILGKAYGTYLFQKVGAKGEYGSCRIALGRDIRTSSTTLRDALVEGMLSTGLSVVDIGVVATPLTYFAANTLHVDGLAMITGSHNPPEFNGFKMGVGKTTFHGSEIQEVRKIAESGNFLRAAVPGEVSHHDIIKDYNHYVEENIKLGSRKLKVVVDAGNGCGGFIAVPLLEKMGFEVIGQFIEPDGTFPNHHPDPTVVKNMLALIDRVKKEKADVGIAYDGDADRIGAVDEQGNILWGDQLMILFAREILKEKPGSVFVSEVKCSQTLYDDIEQKGGKAIMWKAGHSLIKAKMAESGAQLAGEMSGHMFFKHRYFGFDDAIYSTLRLLEILTKTDKPLSALLADVPKTYSSPELRTDFPEELKFQAVAMTRDALKAQGHKTVDVDGVRVIFSDGWGLVRASNTQPLLVSRFEATSQKRMDEIQALVEGVLGDVRKQLGVKESPTGNH